MRLGTSRLRRARAHAQDGFTLIEVVAAVVVLAIAASAVVALLMSSLGVARQNRQRVVATNLASQALQSARAAIKNRVTLPLGQTTSTSTVAGTTYTLVQNASWVTLGQANDACSGAATGQVAYQRVSVKITWPNMGGASKPVSAETVVTPPAGSLSPNTITIPVRLVDSKVQPLANQPVTVTPAGGGTTQTELTDGNGCAVFAQLAPGQYTVGLNSPGYVDTQGVQAHTQTAGQSTPGTVPVVTVLYDVSGTLAMTATPATGYALPGSSTPLRYTVTQSGWAVNPTVVTGTGATMAAQVALAFPFTSANGGVYTAWAGSCTDASPAGYSPPNTTPPTAPVTAPSGLVTSSNTTSLAVPLASVAVTFKTSGGVPITNGTVTARSATAGCSDVYTFPGSTNAAGTMQLALPYGAWKFSVVGLAGGTGSSTTYNATANTTLTPYSPTTQAVTVG